MNRGVWFLAGAGAGIYAMAKARRAAEAFTPEGVRDRLSGLALGAQLLGEELRSEMTTRESELRERLGLGLDGVRHDRQVTDGRPLQLTRKGTL